MKPELPPASTPPASSYKTPTKNKAALADENTDKLAGKNTGKKTGKNTDKNETGQEKSARLPTSARQRRLPSVLVAMLVVYGLWLGWLAYVALINVRAGNQ